MINYLIVATITEIIVSFQPDDRSNRVALGLVPLSPLTRGSLCRITLLHPRKEVGWSRRRRRSWTSKCALLRTPGRPQQPGNCADTVVNINVPSSSIGNSMGSSFSSSATGKYSKDIISYS
ncbi:hypothetical protein HW555_004743 [Spodoptera exigua]|uniref:Uncharacterized protein n=1 Tax=Spodoptera exigua TaxID=7107 RepID=A0A835GLV5_SPOEX|nr:hypothetical protein HW555_004743 [Spodoptera exigua]